MLRNMAPVERIIDRTFCEYTETLTSISLVRRKRDMVMRGDRRPRGNQYVLKLHHQQVPPGFDGRSRRTKTEKCRASQEIIEHPCALSTSYCVRDFDEMVSHF